MQNTRKLANLARLLLRRTSATAANPTTASSGTEQTTHFGYQTVKESEKELKGEQKKQK